MKRALLISIYDFCEEIQKMRELLVNKYGYSYKEIHILSMVSFNKATYKSILNEFADIEMKSGWFDQLWIYYSGHGIENGSIFTIDQRFITIRQIHDFIRKIKCPTLFIFDCCNSGKICDILEWKTLKNGKVIRNHPWPMTNPDIKILCSCKHNEKSRNVYDTIEHVNQGAFTTALLKVLYGLSYRITFTEFYKKIYQELENIGIDDQSPIMGYSSNKIFEIEPKKSYVDIISTIRNVFKNRNMGYR